MTVLIILVSMVTAQMASTITLVNAMTDMMEMVVKLVRAH